jgi:DNA-directed RNA polymerase subunit M/transcription elongation factor TFIIS
MHFCSVCGNMLYIRIADEGPNQLTYYCRNCGHTDDTLTVDNVCVVDMAGGKSGGAKLSHVVNRYTKLDPTLPHIKTIRCPNDSCGSHDDDSKRDVIYIRYDDIAMKYLYICSVCDTMWNTSQE